MSDTARWSILWNTSLFPPQEMLPIESLFHTLPCDNTASTNSKYLFGFTPNILPLSCEHRGSTFHEQAVTDTQSSDNVHDTYEEFSASFAVEEFVSFI